MGVIEKIMPHDEPIHAGEAFFLWQHLMGRYDTQELIQFMMNFVHDKDFKALLVVGLNTIMRQIKTFEEFADKNSIPLPARPPKTSNASNDTEAVRDEVVFRSIVERIQSDLTQLNAAILNAVNNDLRKLYRNFLKEDLDNYEHVMTYAKTKGWLPTFPPYKN